MSNIIWATKWSWLSLGHLLSFTSALLCALCIVPYALGQLEPLQVVVKHLPQLLHRLWRHSLSDWANSQGPMICHYLFSKEQRPANGFWFRQSGNVGLWSQAEGKITPYSPRNMHAMLSGMTRFDHMCTQNDDEFKVSVDQESSNDEIDARKSPEGLRLTTFDLCPSD